MPFPQIDPMRLRVLPLAQRRSYIDIRQEGLSAEAGGASLGEAGDAQVRVVAESLRLAREQGRSRMLTYGAHLIKNGAGPLLNWLIEQGWLTHLATQGAGVIHDWEFAYQGLTSESVADNAPVGRFGTWDETGRFINLAVLVGAAEGLGFGEAVGRMIERQELVLPAGLEAMVREDPLHPLTGARADLLQVMRQFSLREGRLAAPHPLAQCSVLAAAYRKGVPITIHPGIGYDIIANHPLFHGGAIGRASATDTRIFARQVMDLGVYLSVGSAIMSPQVFEKAFSAANNLLLQEGKPALSKHLIAVVDIQSSGGWDWKKGEPPKENPAYYLRYCKSFYRMGGTLEYIQADNRAFLLALIGGLKG
jgi:hypothetical protein